MTNTMIQERAQALYEKIPHDIVVAANTMASTLLCEHDLVLFHAALLAARAQGAKEEGERCADLLDPFIAYAISKDDPVLMGLVQTIRQYIDSGDTIDAIRNPPAEPGKEHT